VEDRVFCCSVLDYAVAFCSLQCVIEAVVFCRHVSAVLRCALVRRVLVMNNVIIFDRSLTRRNACH